MPYLDRTWLYAGTFYGPGDVNLPDEVAQALEHKGAFLPPAAPAERVPTDDLTPQMSPPLASEILARLAAGGYTSGEAIAAASDEELLALKGIGRATLRDIRLAYGGGDADSE